VSRLLDPLRRSARFVFRTLGYRFLWLGKLTYRSPVERETDQREAREAPWYAIDGDQTLRLDYPLGPESLVWDVGGYTGEWARDIVARFACTVEVFEPVPEFVDRLRSRFLHNPGVHVNQYGLAGRDETVSFAVERGASSGLLAPHGARSETVELKDVAAVLAASSGDVDLAKLNIEGGEYALLERLLETGDIARIRFLQIQFHAGVEDWEARMRRIQERLESTHVLSWRYPLIWESWQRRDAA